MTTCLVTGGAGNLACQLTWPLAERFDRIVLLDVADRPVAPVAPAAFFERGDLRDAGGLDALLARHAPAAVIHLASLLSASCEQDRSRAWGVNMDGTFGLFEAALRHGRPTLLFASSVATFGGPPPDLLVDDSPQWPATLYGVTKLAVERLGHYHHARHALDFRCLRLPTTVSRHAPPGAASAVASRAFVETSRSGRFVCTARPDTKLALVYVRDVLRAFLGLLAAPEERLSRRVYNIAGFTATPRDIAAAIGRRLPRAVVEFAPDDAVDRVLAGWPGAIDDTAAPVQASFVVPNLGITIVPLVYGDHHSWNIAWLDGPRSDVPIHLHRAGVEIHLGYGPLHGHTILGDSKAEVVEGYAMPIPPGTRHGYVNVGDLTHHVPFVFGSLALGGWGVFLDVDARPTDAAGLAATAVTDPRMNGTVLLEREIAAAAAAPATARRTLIPAARTDRDGSGGIVLSIATVVAGPLTLESEGFRAVSVVRGRGTLSLCGETAAVAEHDHFGIPGGLPATIHRTGPEPLVLLDTTIEPAGEPTGASPAG